MRCGVAWCIERLDKERSLFCVDSEAVMPSCSDVGVSSHSIHLVIDRYLISVLVLFLGILVFNQVALVLSSIGGRFGV